MRKSVCLLTVVCAAIFAGCTSNMALPSKGIESAHYRYLGESDFSTQPLIIDTDMVNRLNRVKLCGTGATTVTDSVTISYQNKSQASFGIANFGSKEKPVYAIAYTFPGDRGADLRHPCSDKQHQDFVEILQTLLPEGLKP